MRILSLGLGFSAVLLAAPLALPPAAAAAPLLHDLAPYHLADGSGHEPVDWRGRHDDRDDDDHRDWDDDDHDDWDDDDDDWDDDRHRGDWRHGNHWRPGHWGPQPGWHGLSRFRQPLPAWVVEHRLRSRNLHPIGPITLSRGIYLVPVLDSYGRRIVLAVDPLSCAILGQARPW